jgi:hypothetical protein
MRAQLALVALLVVRSLAAQSVARSECFSLDGLSSADRAKAEELYLKILDSEGLYTVAGFKPMSSGFVRFYVSMKGLDFSEVDNARRYLAAFRCGNTVFATVQHFLRTYPNSKTGDLERPFEGVVFHREALERGIQ